MTPSQSRFRELDALSRRRALTENESIEMERCIREIDRRKPKTVKPDWTPSKDARLIELRSRGETFPRIGAALGTTERAVAGRVSRLRAMGVRV